MGAGGIVLALMLVQFPPPSLGVHDLVVVGLDGWGVSPTAPADVADWLADSWVYTLQARTAYDPDSTVGWASVLHGYGPEFHGILTEAAFHPPPGWRSAAPCRHRLPTALDRLALAGHDVAAWSTLELLQEYGTGAAPPVRLVATTEQAVTQAVARLQTPTPAAVRFTLVHIDDVDHAGHHHGWFSAEYAAAVQRAKQWVDRLRSAHADLSVVVTADHGGYRSTHKQVWDLGTLQIPLLVYSTHLPRAYAVPDRTELAGLVANVDVFPTVWDLAGLPASSAFRGRSVLWAQAALVAGADHFPACLYADVYWWHFLVWVGYREIGWGLVVVGGVLLGLGGGLGWWVRRSMAPDWK